LWRRSACRAWPDGRFGAVAASPDDEAAARVADDALWALDGLLAAAEAAPTPPPAPAPAG
jgi:hypothetical protein